MSPSFLYLGVAPDTESAPPCWIMPDLNAEAGVGPFCGSIVGQGPTWISLDTTNGRDSPGRKPSIRVIGRASFFYSDWLNETLIGRRSAGCPRSLPGRSAPIRGYIPLDDVSAAIGSLDSEPHS
jgi:hypothetical protein